MPKERISPSEKSSQPLTFLRFEGEMRKDPAKIGSFEIISQGTELDSGEEKIILDENLIDRGGSGV